MTSQTRITSLISIDKAPWVTIPRQLPFRSNRPALSASHLLQIRIETFAKEFGSLLGCTQGKHGYAGTQLVGLHFSTMLSVG